MQGNRSQPCGPDKFSIGKPRKKVESQKHSQRSESEDQSKLIDCGKNGLSSGLNSTKYDQRSSILYQGPVSQKSIQMHQLKAKDDHKKERVKFDKDSIMPSKPTPFMNKLQAKGIAKNFSQSGLTLPIPIKQCSLPIISTGGRDSAAKMSSDEFPKTKLKRQL